MAAPTVQGASHPAGHDKAIEVALVNISAKVNDVKGSLSSFVGKMEQEQLTWPSVLDSFSALSGHYSTLMKQLNNEKIPSLHNHVTLPNQVSTDRDTELERVTEGRVPILHHEVVPDYLRTKLELDLEARQRDLHSAAAKPSPQFQEDLKKYNNLLDKVISLIDDARDSWEKQSNRGDNLQVNSLEDTKKLVVAYTSGGGLQLMSQSRRVMLMGGRPLGQQQPIQQPMMQQPMARTISRVAPPMGGGARPPMSMTPPNTNPQFYQTSPYKMR